MSSRIFREIGNPWIYHDLFYPYFAYTFLKSLKLYKIIKNFKKIPRISHSTTGFDLLDLIRWTLFLPHFIPNFLEFNNILMLSTIFSLNSKLFEHTFQNIQIFRKYTRKFTNIFRKFSVNYKYTRKSFIQNPFVLNLLKFCGYAVY